MSRRGSLRRRLSLLMAGGFVLMGVLAVVVMTAVVVEEQNEQRDDELRGLAGLILSLGGPHVNDIGSGGRVALPPLGAGLDGGGESGAESRNIVFALYLPDGRLALRSAGAEDVRFPAPAGAARFTETGTYRFYQTGRGPGGLSVSVGDALSERREALHEVVAAFLFPLVPLALIGWLLIRWLVRAGLRPLEDLKAEIAARGRGRLSPIDAGPQPEELARITGTLNDFMSRLATALDAERHFASNTAHELRTPVATALAQVQRLRAAGGGLGTGPRDGAMGEEARAQIDAAEAALKRMARLIERLLQLARAEAGAGPSETACDLVPILRAVVDEQADARIVLDLPGGGDVGAENGGAVLARMDADAFAIVAANLIGNARRHGTGPVTVRLVPGQLEVVNGGAVIPAQVLSGLTRRFSRHDTRGDGLGLGLYISATIARQVGGEVTLTSPAPGRADGVAAWFDFPAV